MSATRHIIIIIIIIFISGHTPGRLLNWTPHENLRVLQICPTPTSFSVQHSTILALSMRHPLRSFLQLNARSAPINSNDLRDSTSLFQRLIAAYDAGTCRQQELIFWQEHSKNRGLYHTAPTTEKCLYFQETI